MALVTVVRNLVGSALKLPHEIYVRPWHFVELEELSQKMRDVLRGLESARVVTICQVLDGTPLPNARL